MNYLSYEIAKALKDNGYPQIPQNGFHFERDEEGKEIDGSVTTPTLSQLIEACGERLEGLIHQINGGDSEWVATQFQPHGGVGTRTASGPTPEEAVARLWLALNKK